eukprot:jgi/Psemu1/1976/gm1.1976_g
MDWRGLNDHPDQTNSGEMLLMQSCYRISCIDFDKRLQHQTVGDLLLVVQGNIASAKSRRRGRKQKRNTAIRKPELIPNSAGFHRRLDTLKGGQVRVLAAFSATHRKLKLKVNCYCCSAGRASCYSIHLPPDDAASMAGRREWNYGKEACKRVH